MNSVTELKSLALRHVVYVDDDEEDGFLFREAFYEMNNNITLSVFENGYDLLDFIQKITDPHQLPCSIICDMQMPLLSGIELLKILKTHAQWQHIPVAVFSTSSAIVDANDSIKSGAVGFFSKPVTFDALKDVIAKILNRCSETISTRLENSRTI